jgi:hypothetical protein
VTTEFVLNAFGPGVLGPSLLPDVAGAPNEPGVVIVERRENRTYPLEVCETLDIAAKAVGDDRSAYALAFSHWSDPAGMWRRAVVTTVCERLRDAGWRGVPIGLAAVIG